MWLLWLTAGNDGLFDLEFRREILWKNSNAQTKKVKGKGREKIYVGSEITATFGFLNKNRPALINTAVFRKARLSGSAYRYK